jgi:hypothetical protein
VRAGHWLCNVKRRAGGVKRVVRTDTLDKPAPPRQHWEPEAMSDATTTSFLDRPAEAGLVALSILLVSILPR